MSTGDAERMKIGVVLPIAEDLEQGGALPYARIRAIARATEAANFDSVWVFDHLIYRFPEQPEFGTWEAWTLMSALAEATERVQIGSIVLCMPFRNPAVLAKMAATLDDVSQGRLILGLGAGWHKPEFDAFGLPFDHRVDRFEEALNIIVPLLREGHVDWNGKYHQAPNCVIRPRGPSSRGPEILIAGSKPRMLRLTATFGDSWNTAWIGEPTLLPERRATLEAACAEVGRDPSTLAVTVGVNIAVPSDDTSSVDPTKTIVGSPADIAGVFAAYEAQGVRHLQCNLGRTDEETVAWLGEALSLHRGS